jgi:TRAP-type uncharacterized transport system substrate-binding protein
MKRILAAGCAVLFAASAHAQMPTLTHEFAQPGGGSDVSAKNLAEVAAANKIASIQTQGGKTLTKSILQVAQGKTDIAATPMILQFLMSRGLGPYSALGRKKGKELAGNLRVLYPYHGITGFFLIAYSSTGIDSWDKLKGRTVFNGPPRGGALNTARSMIRLSAGLNEGKGYKGKQIAWGQATSIFLDRSVDAAVRPGTNPASWMPILLSSAKMNMISVPKAKWEGKIWQKFLAAPGNVPSIFPVSELAHYGKNLKVISEDNMYRTVSASFSDSVHKKMPKALAKALTAAFIKSVPALQRKVPFAKGLLFGEIDDSKMGLCIAGAKMHPGAVEAWEEAGHKVADCLKPKG